MNKYLKITFSVLRNISIPIFNFLILTIGIHFYGKENWGELISIMLWIYFYSFIINWGHRDYLLRTISKNPTTLFDSFFSNFINRTVFLLPTTLLLFLFFPFQTSILAIALIFLTHINSSFESLIIYNQKFLLQLIAESIGFVALCLSMYSIESFSVNSLLALFVLAAIVKNLILFLFIKIPLSKITLRISIQELIVMFPFFLIVFSGWIQSKIDLYIVNVFLPPSSLSEYQLLTTSFLMLQAMAGFILMPLTKYLYRIPKKTAKKIISNLALISIPIVVLGTLSIWFIFENILHLEIEYYIYVIGGISAFPIFLYLINIINLYKKNNEIVVMKLNFIGALLSLSISIMLTPIYGYLGAFIAVLCTQYVLLLLYKTKYNV